MGTYVSNMAKALGQMGHRVIVVTGKIHGRPAEENWHNVTVLRCYDAGDIGSPWLTRKVLALCRDFSVDLIEGQDYLGDCYDLLKHYRRPPILIKVHSCNVLKVLHDSQIWYWWQHFTIRASLFRQYSTTHRERYCIENADLLLGPSQRIFSEMERQGLALPRKRCVVPNPVWPQRISFHREAPNPTVLFVGRKDFGKGVQYLPGIASDLSKKFPNFIMQIVGPDSFARGVGSIAEWTKKRLQAVQKHIVWYDHIEKARLEELYQKAWVVILPSRWDTFPTVLLEAMSWGKPIVATPNGGIPEMLDGTSCRTAAPESKAFVNLITHLLENRKFRKTLGCRLYAKVSRDFNPETVAGRYIAAVNELLNR